MRKKPRLTFVASVSLASLICNTSQAAITVIYSGYSHDALGSQPAAAAGFNTGSVITNGNPSSAHGGSVTTSDNLSTTTRSFGTSYTGDTTTLLNATANVQSVSVFNDPANSGNKQIDGGYFRYIGFTVGVTDSYTFTGSLKSRNSTVTF